MPVSEEMLRERMGVIRSGLKTTHRWSHSHYLHFRFEKSHHKPTGSRSVVVCPFPFRVDVGLSVAAVGSSAFLVLDLSSRSGFEHSKTHIATLTLIIKPRAKQPRLATRTVQRLPTPMRAFTTGFARLDIEWIPTSSISTDRAVDTMIRMCKE
ncbi:hypothetical protein EVAR_76057_1 [Eumeta japonica]|uniref:Uncharacterized protein n=1 Tax=Eumeta variegata TaxID=151549 RepID=A0A4C1W5G4_EUMVA|nr:hypothetical protein EVAR_76057_1 [Eumeta japonica]